MRKEKKPYYNRKTEDWYMVQVFCDNHWLTICNTKDRKEFEELIAEMPLLPYLRTRSKKYRKPLNTEEKLK